MTRKTLLGGAMLAAFMILAAALLTIPARADLVSITQTTLEDFNAGSLYHTGLTRYDDGEVQLMVVGLAGGWITDTNTTGLEPLARHTAVYTNGHILVLGGRDIDDLPSDQIYYTTIGPEDPDRYDLADWQTTTPLPSSIYPNGGLYWHASAVVRDWVYVLGGDDSVTKYATVSFAPINADGTLGSWQTTTDLPRALSLLKAVVVDNRIYVIGGWDQSSAARAEVYFAEPDPATGQISGWTQTTNLAYATFAEMVGSDQGRIYVMGGTHPSLFVSPYTYYATPDPATGLISGWTQTTDMEHNLFGGAGVGLRGVLFTTGGAINNLTSPSDYVGATLIASTGGVGSWIDTSLVNPGRFYHATVASDDGWLYVINGSDGTDPILNINRGATSGEGAHYAPDGTFTSSPIDLGRKYKLRTLEWNCTISDTTKMSITMEYRTQDTVGNWSPWHGPYPSSLTPGTVTTTVTLAGSARYVQYRATLYTSDDTMTPVLNAVRLVYEVLPYSLQVFKDADPAPGTVLVPSDEITYTLTYSNGLGGITTTNVVVYDAPPQYTSYISGSIFGPGADDSNPNMLYWTIGTVNPGESGQVGYRVLVSPTLQENTFIENIATIDSDQGPQRNSNMVSHAVQVEYDVIVAKSAIPASGGIVTGGNLITYTLNYGNIGSQSVTTVVLTDVLPAEVTYVPGSIWPAGQGNDSNPSHLTWNVGALATGGAGSVGFRAVVNSGLPFGTIITNTGQIDSGQTTPEVGTAVYHVVGTPPETRTLTKWANPPDGSTVDSGQTIAYTLFYQNNGQEMLTGVVLADVLPAEISYVPGSIWPVEQGNASNPDQLTWTIGNLAAGGNGAVGFQAVVKSGLPSGTIITNLASIDSEQTDPEDSPAVHHMVGTSPSILTLTKSANPAAGSAVESGQTIAYTLFYQNTGPTTLPGLVLTDAVPDYVTYVPGSIWPAGQGDASDPQTLTWALPNLAPGASGTAGFSVTVDDVPGDLAIENQFTAAGGQIGLEYSNVITHFTQREAPDLKVTAIQTIPAKPGAGEPFIVKVTVKNVGTEDTDLGAFWTEVYIKPYPDGPWPTGPSDHYLGMCPDPGCSQYRLEYVQRLNSLAAGASSTLQFSGITLPGSEEYWAYAQVDVTLGTEDPLWGRYLEASENNNMMRIKIDNTRVYLPMIAKKH